MFLEILGFFIYSYVGFYCEIIKGFLKGVGYKFGMKFDGLWFWNFWIVVFLEGFWCFINCNWGVRYIKCIKNIIFYYCLDEFYFVIDLEDYIY